MRRRVNLEFQLERVVFFHLYSVSPLQFPGNITFFFFNLLSLTSVCVESDLSSRVVKGHRPLAKNKI